MKNSLYLPWVWQISRGSTKVKGRRFPYCGSPGVAVWFGFTALVKKAAAALWQVWLVTVFHSALLGGIYCGSIGLAEVLASFRVGQTGCDSALGLCVWCLQIATPLRWAILGTARPQKSLNESWGFLHFVLYPKPHANENAQGIHLVLTIRRMLLQRAN